MNDLGTTAIQVMHNFGHRWGSVETRLVDPDTPIARLLQMGLSGAVSSMMFELDERDYPFRVEANLQDRVVLGYVVLACISGV